MDRSQVRAKLIEAQAEVIACRRDWCNAGSAERKRAAADLLDAARQSARWWHGELCLLSAEEPNRAPVMGADELACKVRYDRELELERREFLARRSEGA